jgi:hypothetical protein
MPRSARTIAAEIHARRVRRTGAVIAKMTNATTELASVKATVQSLSEVDLAMAVQAARRIASSAISIPASPTSPVSYPSPITRLWTSYS